MNYPTEKEKREAIKWVDVVVKTVHDPVVTDSWRRILVILDRSRWRPIEDIHEDYSACVLINVNDDPSYMEIGSVNSLDFDSCKWTHFVPVPILLTVDLKHELS